MTWFDRFTKKPTPKKRVTIPDAEADMPTISARVPRAVKDWIREEAQAEDIPMSAVVRQIVEEAHRAPKLEPRTSTPVPVPPENEEEVAEAADQIRTHRPTRMPTDPSPSLE